MSQFEKSGYVKDVGKPDADSTPAMAAGVANRLWEIRDIVALLGQDDSN